MTFGRAVRLLVEAWVRPAAAVRNDDLPEIQPGTAAAWARANDALQAPAPVLGAPCLTDDGRRGRFVEVIEGNRIFVVCEVI